MSTTTNYREDQAAAPAAHTSDGHDPRSLGTLIKEIRDEATILFRQEAALARTEISEKVSQASRNVMMLAAGGLVAFAGLIVILIALGYALTAALAAAGMEVNALWLGPLIVGVIAAAIGGGMLLKARQALESENLMPEKTTESLKENKEWIKHKTTR